MNPSHHPSPAVLGAYARGELRAAFVIAAGAHVRDCPACEAAVRAEEAQAGAALLRQPPADIADDGFARALERADDPLAANEDGGGPIEFGRKRWAAPGLWVRHAPRAVKGEDQLFLLKAPPGVGIRHRHGGLEFTAILRGSIQDGDETFGAGDFTEMSGADEHRPAAGERGCLCLIASERRMRMLGLPGLIAQRLTGA